MYALPEDALSRLAAPSRDGENADGKGGSGASGGASGGLSGGLSGGASGGASMRRRRSLVRCATRCAVGLHALLCPRFGGNTGGAMPVPIDLLVTMATHVLSVDGALPLRTPCVHAACHAACHDARPAHSDHP